MSEKKKYIAPSRDSALYITFTIDTLLFFDKKRYIYIDQYRKFNYFQLQSVIINEIYRTWLERRQVLDWLELL